jgi:ABC-type lipoprotein export system ATPase subunit
MISVSGLSKFYGEGDARTAVLDDVSLTIEAGDFVAIVGTSGSGKTTLLNVIGGLDRGWEGEVSVEGKSLGGLNDSQLAAMRNEKLGFVFQQFNLLDHLSALENVVLPAFFAKDGNDAEANERARTLLEKVGLGDKLQARPPELSGGQKQRVAIARALLRRPRFILCDEPTGSLDRDTGIQVLDIFRKLNADDDITIVMVTHEEHIARMARRIVRLEDGVVVADETVEAAQSDHTPIV